MDTSERRALELKVELARRKAAGGRAQAAPADVPPADDKALAEWQKTPFKSTPQERYAAESPGESISRQVGEVIPGYLGSAEVRGMTALPHMVLDPFVNLARQAGLPKGAFATADEERQALESVFGGPKTPGERTVSDIFQNLSGTRLFTKGASALADVTEGTTQRVMQALAADPVKQAASAALAGAAGGGTREAGGGPGLQAAASLAAGGTPFLPGAAAAGTKALLRGSEENIPDMNRAMGAAERAGTTLSAGQASGKPIPQWLEGVLRSVFPSSFKMREFGAKQAEDLGKRVTDIAESRAKDPTLRGAGATIVEGIEGDAGFINRFKQQQSQLHNAVDAQIKDDEQMWVSHFNKALNELTTTHPNAPELSKWITSGDAKRLLKSLEHDLALNYPETGVHQVPYSVIKRLRTMIGEKLSDRSLADKTPRSVWDKLYGALSQDIDSKVGDLARSTGNAKLAQDWKRAQEFTRAGYDRINRVLSPLIGKNRVPEEIARLALDPAQMKRGGSRLGSLFHSLAPDERDEVRGAFIQHLGEAKPGQQSAEGGDFSINTFLTNWNKISPTAKSILFEGQGQLRQDLDAIAQTAERIQGSIKALANTSRTAEMGTAIGEVGALGGAVATGNVPALAGILASMGGARVAANKLTDPKFVRWLASTTEKPAAAVPALLNEMAQFQSEKRP